ncbi:MAG: response regulator [Pseudomonadota bacterium]
MNTPSENGRLPETSSPITALLIDDNPAVSVAMEIAFRMAGYRLDTAVSPEDAFSRLATRRYDAILLDMNFTAGRADGNEGLACLERIVADDPAACVVVITAHSGIRIAVTAMQAGARDFVMKPWRNAELLDKVKTAIARRSDRTPASRTLPIDADPVCLLGDSQVMRSLRDLIRRIGPTSASVTITGPSGSGRSLAAMAVIAASRDAGTAPVRIDLRDEDAWGLLEVSTGTALMRHADALPDVAQMRLLDRLPAQLRCIVVADDVSRLSPALYRRIATAELTLPPLASRADDAVLLARHFVRMAAERFGRPVPTLTGAAETLIRSTSWPGEVRGLALAIERAVLLVESGTIDAAALAVRDPAGVRAVQAGDAVFDLGHTEKAVIEAALHQHHHNVTHAADALGLSRGALYRRMARHGL